MTTTLAVRGATKRFGAVLALEGGGALGLPVGAAEREHGEHRADRELRPQPHAGAGAQRELQRALAGGDLLGSFRQRGKAAQQPPGHRGHSATDQKSGRDDPPSGGARLGQHRRLAQRRRKR